MKVYRDCFNGAIGFDDPAFLTVFDASGTPYTTLQVALTSSISLPSSIIGVCAPVAGNNACVDESIYTATVTI